MQKPPDWLGKQKLESVVALGLLPLIKAVERDSDPLGYIDLHQVVSSALTI